MRANFRFFRFSATVRSLPRGFFFRLADLGDRWLVPLESRIFVQDRARRIGNALVISNRLIVRLADSGLAQEADTLTGYIRDDHVLVAVCLLLPTVMQSLFLRAFRPLAAPFRPVDDEPRLALVSGLALSKATGVALRENSEIIEGTL
jgi:hypothetical protein